MTEIQGMNERALKKADDRGADRLVMEVARLVERQVIDSRSPAADALLDYKGGKFYGPTGAAALLCSEPQGEGN